MALSLSLSFLQSYSLECLPYLSIQSVNTISCLACGSRHHFGSGIDTFEIHSTHVRKNFDCLALRPRYVSAEAMKRCFVNPLSIHSRPVTNNTRQQLYFNPASPWHFPQPCPFRHVRRTAVVACRVKRRKYSTAGLHDKSEKHDFDHDPNPPKVPLDKAERRRIHETQLIATQARKAEKAERRRIIEEQQKRAEKKRQWKQWKLLSPEEKDGLKEDPIHAAIDEEIEQETAKLTQLDSQTLNAEKFAKLDVYNYCARFLLVPTFHVRQINQHTRFGAASIEVTIELQQQELQAIARSRDLKTAEIAASIKFKEQSAEYHSKHGVESIFIKDSTALDIANVRDFFAFYKAKHPGAVFSAKTTTETVVPSANRECKAQVILNGDPVGNPVTMLKKKQAEQLAHLGAAIFLLRNEPGLLESFRGVPPPTGSRRLLLHNDGQSAPIGDDGPTDFIPDDGRKATAHDDGTVLAPVPPFIMEVEDKTMLKMRNVLAEVSDIGLPHVAEGVAAKPELEASTFLRNARRLTDAESRNRCTALEAHQSNYMTCQALAGKRKLKDSLPIRHHSDAVLKHVNDNMYSVIVGATGSGKTTQVPQILIEDAISKNSGASCNVICTQPRRIAAISVARRVADERNERLQDTVGYQIRFDSRLPKTEGSIIYCTTGILLQRLQHQPDQVLDSVSHVIIDEVHERDVVIDFLMVTLKKLIPARRAAAKTVPKLVLMSATIDPVLFTEYFEETTSDGIVHRCPSLHIPGRTFPVKEKYLEDIIPELQQSFYPELDLILQGDKESLGYLASENCFSATGFNKTARSDDGESIIVRSILADGQLMLADEKGDLIVPISLVVAAVAHVAKSTVDGAILAFLPGYQEIKKVSESLKTTSPLGMDFNDKSRFRVFMLHSSVPVEEQTAVFDAVPKGCRKIILSTNVAETSITIPDVQHVIDSGKLRENRYDQIRGISKLSCTWISKSNAKQRAGRAGRVQNGNYYALYSRARYESLRDIGLPEMLRSDLQEVCLDIKAQALTYPIREFLSESIEPPSAAVVNSAILRLQGMQALTEDERLTPLGRVLASLPIHPSFGKMIVLGIIFRCLDSMIVLGAALSERPIFATPLINRFAAHEAHREFIDDDTPSDHAAFISAFTQMREILNTHGWMGMSNFATNNYLDIRAFNAVHQTSQQIEEVLVEAGLIPSTPEHERFDFQIGSKALNSNSDNLAIVRALTLAGVFPNIAVLSGRTSFRTRGQKDVIPHPTSVNHIRTNRKATARPQPLISFTTLSKSNDGRSTFMRDTTPVSPLMATMFGGRMELSGRVLTLDEWLPLLVNGPEEHMDIIVMFRRILDTLLVAAFSDLADFKARNAAHRYRNGDYSKMDTNTGTYLADDPVMEIFARGLVEVLDIDAAAAKRRALHDDQQ